MKSFLQILAFLGLVVAVATGSCLVTRTFLRSEKPTGQPVEAHLWIHRQLNLTADQDQRLEPLEKRYHDEHTHLIELIHLANMELGQVILEEKGPSPKVRAAVEKVHAVQGKLQNLTLEHVFEMKAVLTPKQYQKLLSLTANALYEIDSSP